MGAAGDEGNRLRLVQVLREKRERATKNLDFIELAHCLDSIGDSSAEGQVPHVSPPSSTTSTNSPANSRAWGAEGQAPRISAEGQGPRVVKWMLDRASWEADEEEVKSQIRFSRHVV